MNDNLSKWIGKEILPGSEAYELIHQLKGDNERKVIELNT